MRKFQDEIKESYEARDTLEQELQDECERMTRLKKRL